MSDADATRPFEGVNPYAPPRAELAGAESLYPPVQKWSHLERFSVDAAFRRAWEVYKRNYGLCMAAVLGPQAVNVALQFVGPRVIAPLANAQGSPAVSALADVGLALAVLTVSLLLAIGQTTILLKLARGQKARFDDIFGGARFFFPFLGAAILSMLVLMPAAFVSLMPGVLLAAAIGSRTGAVLGLVGVSVVLAVAVVFTLSARMYLFPYVIVDRNCGPINAIRIAFEVTRGHTLGLIGLMIAGAMIGGSGLLACFVGVVFTMPLTPLMLACGYVLLTGRGYPLPAAESETWAGLESPEGEADPDRRVM